MLPVIIWTVSAVICFGIAKYRNIKQTFLRSLIVLFLGPIAIPLVFFIEPEAGGGKT